MSWRVLLNLSFVLLFSELSCETKTVTIDNTVDNPVPVKPAGTTAINDVTGLGSSFSMIIGTGKCGFNAQPNTTPTGKFFVVKTLSGGAFMSPGGTIHMSLDLASYTPTATLEIPLQNQGLNTVAGSGIPFQMFSALVPVDLIIPSGGNGFNLRVDCNGTFQSARVNLLGYLIEAPQ
jgi:hypothetical protein